MGRIGNLVVALAMSTATAAAAAPRGFAAEATSSAARVAWLLAPSVTTNPAPSPATPLSPKNAAPKEGAPFYKSWWFWGAIGGAVAIGSTALIVANTGGASQIEMQMHIPR